MAEQAPQKPSIGRVVHFTDDNGRHNAATVAHVNEDGSVNLGYLDINGHPYSASSIPFDESGETPRTWHWPERV